MSTNTQIVTQTEEKQQTREQRHEEARTILDAGLEHIENDPDVLAAFLRFRARFRTYSWSNALLIMAQRPGAQYCMGYKAWQKYGRQVRKGERGLMIWAPVIRRVRTQDEADEKGVQVGEKALFGYRIAWTFDISQTVVIPGEEETALQYVSPIPEIEGDDFAHLYEDLKVVASRLAYHLEEYTSEITTQNGFCHFKKRIIGIRSNRPANGMVKTLAHELVHAAVHAKDVADGKRLSRAVLELQAEGAAFLFCYMLGLDTSSYSLPYLKDYETGDVRLADQLTTIEAIAFYLLDLLDQQRGEASASLHLAEAA